MSNTPYTTKIADMWKNMSVTKKNLLMFILLIVSFAVFNNINSFKTNTITQSSHTEIVKNTLYINKEHKFQIKFPLGWDVGPTKYTSSPTIVQRAVYDGDKNISIFIDDFAYTQKTIKEFGTSKFMADGIVKNAATSFKKVTLIDYGEEVINNELAYWIRYSGTLKSEDKSRDILLYTFFKNKKLYQISATVPSNEFEDYSEVIVQAINSFRFVD